jgi:hypothetical protein
MARLMAGTCHALPESHDASYAKCWLGH